MESHIIWLVSEVVFVNFVIKTPEETKYCKIYLLVLSLEQINRPSFVKKKTHTMCLSTKIAQNKHLFCLIILALC